MTARRLLTDWRPWRGDTDGSAQPAFVCMVRDFDGDEGPLRQIVQADNYGHWYVYESNEALDDTPLDSGTAPDLASARDAADAAAVRWYDIGGES